jgi:hypothetical protein
MEILKLIYLAMQSFSSGVVSFIYSPDYIINPILIIIILIMMSQYKKIISIQRQMYGGRVKTRLRDLVASSILAGLLAGLAGSILITVLGVTFMQLSGLLTVIIFSLFLMFFVNPRYVCLSYSGGILSIFSLILAAFAAHGFVDKNDQFYKLIQSGLNFDVSGLMVIVGIMHLIEAILMWVDGHRGAVPVFMKHKGKLVGGFVMQRLWIIPILFFIVVTSSDVVGQTIATPNWWPLFGPNISKEALKTTIFAAMPLIAMLAYNDFSLSTPVVQKVRRTSIELFCFSIILLILAIISYKIYVFKYIAAIFAPLAHETLILYERLKESSGTPLWKFAEDGVIVVDTLPLSTAEKIGIKSGDKLVGINNTPVNSIEDVIQIMSNYLNYIWIDIINLKGEKRIIEFANYQGGIKELGIITVPKDDNNIVFVEENNDNLFKRITRRFKK